MCYITSTADVRVQHPERLFWRAWSQRFSSKRVSDMFDFSLVALNQRCDYVMIQFFHHVMTFWATTFNSSSVLMASSLYDRVSRSTCMVCWPIRGGGVASGGLKLLKWTAGPETERTVPHQNYTAKAQLLLISFHSTFTAEMRGWEYFILHHSCHFSWKNTNPGQ